MTIQRIKIDEYRVMYSSKTFKPRIGLLNAGKNIGQLIFLPNGKDLPPDTRTVGAGSSSWKGPTWSVNITLHYHLENFKNVIDLLRNEQPMYLVYAGSGIGDENGIDSFPEPVGEGETS